MRYISLPSFYFEELDSEGLRDLSQLTQEEVAELLLIHDDLTLMMVLGLPPPPSPPCSVEPYEYLTSQGIYCCFSHLSISWRELKGFAFFFLLLSNFHLL